MPNPVMKTIAVGAAPTLVAEDIQSALVKIKKTAGSGGKIKYMETYVLTGETAPTDQTTMVSFDDVLDFNHSQNADVYVGVVGTESGLVRVDA